MGTCSLDAAGSAARFVVRRRGWAVGRTRGAPLLSRSCARERLTLHERKWLEPAMLERLEVVANPLERLVHLRTPPPDAAAGRARGRAAAPPPTRARGTLWRGKQGEAARIARSAPHPCAAPGNAPCAARPLRAPLPDLPSMDDLKAEVEAKLRAAVGDARTHAWTTVHALRDSALQSLRPVVEVPLARAQARARPTHACGARVQTRVKRGAAAPAPARRDATANPAPLPPPRAGARCAGERARDRAAAHGGRVQRGCAAPAPPEPSAPTACARRRRLRPRRHPAAGVRLPRRRAESRRGVPQ